jgi:hypothetical protein
MTENKINFGVLGPLQMTVDGAPVSLGTPKQRVVLAVLLMNRNRPVGIASLITAAWQRHRDCGRPPESTWAGSEFAAPKRCPMVTGSGSAPTN